MCNGIGIVVIAHDERRPSRPSAPVVMEHDDNRDHSPPSHSSKITLTYQPSPTGLSNSSG